MKRKNSFALVVIFLIAGVFFVLFNCGCKKDEVEISRSEGLEQLIINDIELITLQDDLKGNELGSRALLGFKDEEHYENVYLLLEELVDKHNDAFLEKYGHLNDDDLNEMEEAIGFDEFKPLRELEEKIGFLNSMRITYAIAEEEWLNNEFLDPETDPSNQYGFCELEMVLLNDLGEVKIGESLYKFSNDGYVKFTDGDLSKLARYSSDDMEVLNESNVVSYLYYDCFKSSSDDDEPNCKGWRSYTDSDEYDIKKKKVKFRVYFRAMTTRVVAKSKIWSYKRKSNGKWRRHRMSLGVANQCYIYDNDCESLKWQAWSGWKEKRRTSLTKRNINWGAFQGYRAKNGESVFGSFKYAGNEVQLALKW